MGNTKSTACNDFASLNKDQCHKLEEEQAIEKHNSLYKDQICSCGKRLYNMTNIKFYFYHGESIDKYINIAEKIHCDNCHLDHKIRPIETYKKPIDVIKILLNRDHCCQCKIENIPGNKHCCKCHKIYLNSQWHCDTCCLTGQKKYGHCCKCRKIYSSDYNHCDTCCSIYKKKSDTDHCTKCCLTYDMSNETHCKNCCTSHDNDYKHCCKCEIIYAKHNHHCCKCNVVWSASHNCLKKNE